MKDFCKNVVVAHLNDGAVHSVRQMAHIRTVNIGDRICSQGDGESPLILVLSGQLYISTMSEDGEEEGLFAVDAGDAVGGASILQDVAAPGNAVATKNSRLAILNRENVRRLLGDSQFLLGLSRSISIEVLAFAKRRGSRGVRRSTARVAATLLPMIDTSGPGSAASINSPGNETIARLSGVSRETVSRVLSALERRGTISKHGRRLQVLDLGSLEQFAAGR